MKIDEAAPVWCSDRGSDNDYPHTNRKESLHEKSSPDSATRQGRDVSASTATSGVPAEEIETKVALIQTLIPLGLYAVGEALETEVVSPWPPPGTA